LDSLASAIWYFYSLSAIVLEFRLLFSFCNLVFAFSFYKKNWSDILSSASAKSGISTFLQLLQFGIFVLSLQLFWYFVFSSVSAIWYLHSVSTKNNWSDILSSASAKSGISIFLQLLQFGIFVMSLQLFWYSVFSSVSPI
jgi:xanthine/uracil permease